MKPHFAFVEFENAKDAEHAIETMNGVSIDGHKLEVERPRARGERGPR